MRLKLLFYLLLTVIFSGFAFLTWFLSAQLMNGINEKWGSQFVERQVVFDKYRTLSPLLREISLAKEMAADPDIIEMAKQIPVVTTNWMIMRMGIDTTQFIEGPPPW